MLQHRTGCFIICFLWLCCYNRLQGQALQADAATLLLLHFDNSITGVAGEIPTASSNINYGSGKVGNALQVSSNTTLRFDTAQNFNPKKGSLEAWVYPTTEGALLDMGTAGGLSVQIGNYTRMIFNIYGINGNPEAGVFGNNIIWKPNTWYHLAFTWENRELKLYYNGNLAFESTIGFEPPNINLSYFNIGSLISGNYQMQGLIDELRISNRARTATEICQSYMMGNGGIQTLAVKNAKPIVMYPTWAVYLNKTGWYQTPQLVSVNGTDSTVVSSACISWSVGNPLLAEIVADKLIAKSPGNTFLTGSIGNQSVQIPVEIKTPVLSQEKLLATDPFLATPAACHTALIPVLVIVYLPTKDGVNFDQGEIPDYVQTLAQAKAHSLRVMQHTKFSLEEGSKFRGYANANAKPYLGYKVVDYIYVYEPLPLSIQDNPSFGNYWVDYYQVVERQRGKYYVDTLGVKEIWLMGYHTDKVSPLESNMSSKTTGNISNSYRREDDLPKYERTYLVYNYNITRGGNEATHNHGHQVEAMAAYVNQLQDGNVNLFNRDFRGYTGNGGPLNRCGDTHHPPNSRLDYDYDNSTLVASDILNWKPSGGQQTMVNNSTWGSIAYNWPSSLYPQLPPNAESNWYIMWMQSIPGNGNQVPYGTKYLTNWWRFMADWDSATARVGLYQDAPEQNLDGCAVGGITYTFTGNGKWSNVTNWMNRLRPPNPMPAGHKIIIDHAPGGNCIVDVPFKMYSGMQIEVKPNKQLIWQK